MISEGGEECGGVADFRGCEQEQVAAGSFGHSEIRWIEAHATRPPGARVRLLLCTNQGVDGEGDCGNEPADPDVAKAGGGQLLSFLKLSRFALSDSSGGTPSRSYSMMYHSTPPTDSLAVMIADQSSSSAPR